MEPLKTRSSERDVPLVGAALGCTESVRKQSERVPFPRYCSEADQADTLAAREQVVEGADSIGYVFYSFRHSHGIGCGLGVPPEIINK